MPNDEPQAENGCATRSSLSDTLGGAAERYKKIALVLPQSRRHAPFPLTLPYPHITSKTNMPTDRTTHGSYFIKSLTPPAETPSPSSSRRTHQKQQLSPSIDRHPTLSSRPLPGTTNPVPSYTLIQAYEFLIQAVHRRYPVDRTAGRDPRLPLPHGRHGNSERRQAHRARLPNGPVRQRGPHRRRLRPRPLHAHHPDAAHPHLPDELGQSVQIAIQVRRLLLLLAPANQSALGHRDSHHDSR